VDQTQTLIKLLDISLNDQNNRFEKYPNHQLNNSRHHEISNLYWIINSSCTHQVCQKSSNWLLIFFNPEVIESMISIIRALTKKYLKSMLLALGLRRRFLAASLTKKWQALSCSSNESISGSRLYLD
jgi:hypothetical protein